MNSSLQSTIHIGSVWCPHCLCGPDPCFRYVPKNGSCLYYTDEAGIKKRMFSSKGAVDWYIPGRKRAFARTTQQEARYIYDLYRQEKDLRKVLKRLPESESIRSVIAYYVRRKIYRLELPR